MIEYLSEDFAYGENNIGNKTHVFRLEKGVH